MSICVLALKDNKILVSKSQPFIFGLLLILDMSQDSTIDGDFFFLLFFQILPLVKSTRQAKDQVFFHEGTRISNGLM